MTAYFIKLDVRFFLQLHHTFLSVSHDKLKIFRMAPFWMTRISEIVRSFSLSILRTPVLAWNSLSISLYVQWNHPSRVRFLSPSIASSKGQSLLISHWFLLFLYSSPTALSATDFNRHLEIWGKVMQNLDGFYYIVGGTAKCNPRYQFLSRN